MKYLQFLLSLMIVLTFGSVSNAQDRQQLKEEIDKLIYFETEISHESIPGFTIGVIFQDSTFVYNYGHQSKKGKQSLTSSSVFEIGSITKVFTSTLVSILVEEKILDYDSTLNSYLKSKCRNKALEGITIRQLVSHCSGLPKMPIDFGAHEKELNNPYAHYSKKQLLNFYKKFKPTSQDKKANPYLYSHVNFGLLEIAIENASGRKYEDLLFEKVLQPAGMLNTFATRKKGKEVQLTKAYTRSGKATGPWEFQSFTASEGLKSTTDDLLTFLKIHLNLQESSFAALLENNTTEKINTGMSENGFMGNAWHIVKLKKYYDVILHGGATGGHRAFIGFVKETQTGVVILSNSETGTGGLGYLILRMINYNWKKQK